MKPLSLTTRLVIESTICSLEQKASGLLDPQSNKKPQLWQQYSLVWPFGILQCSRRIQGRGDQLAHQNRLSLERTLTHRLPPKTKDWWWSCKSLPLLINDQGSTRQYSTPKRKSLQNKMFWFVRWLSPSNGYGRSFSEKDSQWICSRKTLRMLVSSLPNSIENFNGFFKGLASQHRQILEAPWKTKF